MEVRTVQRWRMSREEYDALPDKERTEYVRGEVLVMPPANHRQGFIVGRLSHLLLSRLTGVVVGPEIGWEMSRELLRGPDVLVAAAPPTSGPWVTETPVLVVEVLSPTSRSEDTVRKPTEYLAGGVGQFWLVDPDLRTIDVYRNAGESWGPLLHLDEDHPSGAVEVVGHGPVPLDLIAVLDG